jgi:PTH1 family peptidyl-tRNA hydrolase
MILIVGLGNPGKRYEHHRHNVGFMVAAALRRAENLPDPREKFSGAFTKGDALAILEPMTFMTASGDSVQPCAAFLKTAPERIVVVHDELDLPFGDVRIKVGGGHAGHNGLRSVIQRLGSADFVRVRVGIGRPPASFQGDVAAYVLASFDANERAALGGVVDRAVAAVRAIAADGVAAAMNVHNAAPGAGAGAAKRKAP